MSVSQLFHSTAGRVVDHVTTAHMVSRQKFLTHLLSPSYNPGELE